jgi:DedD protein
MDSRAKQRLTGAIILVALFVLLVPELLTGPRGADVPGSPAEEGMRRYTIDLNAANPSAPPVESPPPPPVVALPQPVSDAQRAQPGEEAVPAIAEPAPVVAAAPPAPAPAPSVAQSVSPAPRVEAQKSAVVPPAAPAPAAIVPTEKGSFAVQLGSFGSRENADRLVRDMAARGFAAFVAPIKSGGRELYRVRVGPTRDRAQAEALATQLRRVGQSGSIVPIS